MRQHVKYYTKQLSEELAKRGIPFHNEQGDRGLDSEPAAVLVFSFLRVIADDGQAEAYDELMRLF